MKTIKIKVYKFKELNEDAKSFAIEYYKNGNNATQDGWYDHILEDASDLGIEFDEFDVTRGWFITKLKAKASTLVGNILERCEKDSELFVIARRYAEKMADNNHFSYQSDKNVMDRKFINDVSKYFMKILKGHFEYTNTDTYIAEYYDANDYWFLECGVIIITP